MILTRRQRNAAAVRSTETPAADPVRAFADWAMQRAAGICWVRLPGDVDGAFDALGRDLPELLSSGVRWSGAGVLASSEAEWYAFAGEGCAVLVVALSTGIGPRQEAVLHALGRHGAKVVAGGRVPRHVARDLAGLVGVPVWRIAGMSRTAPNALIEPGHPTLAA